MLLDSAVLEPDRTDFMYVFPTGQWSHFESFKSVLEERGKEEHFNHENEWIDFLFPLDHQLLTYTSIALEVFDVIKWYGRVGSIT